VDETSASATLRTAGQPASIRLTPDRRTIWPTGQDLSFVTVEVLDAKGVLCPNANLPIQFHLTGPGAIAGVGNGDPLSMESFQQPRRKAYRGRALVVIQAARTNGPIHLTATAQGLRGETVVEVRGPVHKARGRKPRGSVTATAP
jgi:beta-galactosidase